MGLHSCISFLSPVQDNDQHSLRHWGASDLEKHSQNCSIDSISSHAKDCQLYEQMRALLESNNKERDERYLLDETSSFESSEDEDNESLWRRCCAFLFGLNRKNDIVAELV